jgi:indolepyruvate ferredoxin oxidoreductase
MPDPNQRIFINPDVCEGCGDCGVQSNCVAILPLETELGRKRKIDQSTCNKDFSCVKGFCPSFVTVSGGALRKPEAAVAVDEKPPLPEPAFAFDTPVSYVLTGVGGTGVVTIAALLGMAAHIEGKGCGIIDMAGLAQKGGAVTSHIRLAPRPEDISAIRIGPGGADVMLGCDMLVSADSGLLKLMSQSGHLVVNTNEMPTGGFTRDTEERLPSAEMAARLRGIVDEGQVTLADTSRMAVRLLGDTIASNLLLLGIAWQKGLIPLSSDAIEQAIKLNGIAVQQSINAFRWGRKWVVDADSVDKVVTATEQRSGLGAVQPLTALHDIIADRMERLTHYQNAAYAIRYREKLANVIAADTDAGQHLSKAAARYLYKMMAIKDEYEVARLYTDGRFTNALSAQFEGDISIAYHLAPPLFSGTDPATGRPKKAVYGSWVKSVMAVLATCKSLRGTAFDLFGYTAERKTERAALTRYEAVLDDVAARLTTTNYAAAVQLVSVPEQIRGFGPVRHAHLVAADKTYAVAQAEFDKLGDSAVGGTSDREPHKHTA